MVLILKNESPILLKFHNSVWKYVVPLLTAEWLHLELCFSPEYHISRQNILIFFWKSLADIQSEAGLNHVCEYINGILFAINKIRAGEKSGKNLERGE